MRIQDLLRKKPLQAYQDDIGLYFFYSIKHSNLNKHAA